MKPTRCPVCQSDQLTDLRLFLGGGFFVSFLVFVKLQAAACLHCGAVTRYLDDATVATLRAHLAKPPKASSTNEEL